MGPGFESLKVYQIYVKRIGLVLFFLCITIWLVGQAVKTPASHAGDGGSIPPRVTTSANSSVGQSYRLITGWSGVRVPVGAPVTGVWFNGRIGVSKTFDVGSIPTTPANT